MKYLFTLTLVLLFTQFGKSQTIDPGLKDCLQGKYVFMDENKNTFALYLKPTMALEFVGHIYGAPFGEDESRHIGEFNTYGGKWGADENTVNLITGTFKDADQYKNDKKAPEYYAWHFQNAGYKGTYDLDKGTITIMGKTYVRSEGPCSQMRLKEHEANREGQSEGTKPVKPAPALIYTGRESDLDKLKDQYIETFSESGSYNAYVAGENIKRLGVSMAKDFSDNLKSIGQLIETTDPEALQKDYMEKMKNIENLEAEFNAESNSYFFQSGQDLGNSILNEDYESAMFQAGGLLNAHLERKEAEKELAKQKAELKAAKRKQMRALYNKAKDFNNQKRKEFLLLAANSEGIAKEQFYLQMVENIDCYQETMWQGYLYDKPNWMDNKCPMPKLGSSSKNENKFTSDDARLSKIAEHKYEVFLKTSHSDFRKAAISFASSACSKNPSAKYFDQIAKYYASYSAVLELTNYLAAEQIDESYYSIEGKDKIDSLKHLVELEVTQALEANNVKYIQAFINTGLDKVINIKEQSLFHYTLSIDQPNALQTILNTEIEGKNEKEILNTMQSSIILCAASNSKRCLDKFAELGISLDFVYKNEHPIEVAEKTLSEDAFISILKNSEKGSFYKEKYKDSPIHILLTSYDSPTRASKMLEAIFDTDDFSRVVDRMINQLEHKEQYFETLGSSEKVSNYTRNNSEASIKILSKLRKSIFLPNYKSKSHLFFKHNLVSFQDIPTLKDLGFSYPVTTKSINHVSSIKSEWINDKSPGYQYFDPEYNYNYYDLNADLGYISFNENNPFLFRVLDDKYDMSESKAPNEQSLFERILYSGSFQNIYSFPFYQNAIDYIVVNSNFNCSNQGDIDYRNRKDNEYVIYDNPHTILDFSEMELQRYSKELQNKCKVLEQLFSFENYFYSPDFDFSKKINGEFPIFIFLDNALSTSKNSYFKGMAQPNNIVLFDFYQILKRYNFDTSIQDSKGETLLHWFARHIVGYNPHLKGNMAKIASKLPNAEFINDLNIDKGIKNKNGQTAYDLFKILRKEIPEKCTDCNSVLLTFDGVLDENKDKIIFNSDHHLYEGLNREKWLKAILK